MEKLKIKVDKFHLKRRLEAKITTDKLSLRGIDSDGCPYSFIKDVKARINNKDEILSKDPF